MVNNKKIHNTGQYEKLYNKELDVSQSLLSRIKI